MVMQVTQYVGSSETPPEQVMERGGVYLQAGSPFWMIRFRYRGRLIRESSKVSSKREALAHRKRRMAEFGLGKGVFGPEIPTLGEAAEALLTHIVAAKKSGRAQVRSHLRSLVDYFGSDTRIAEILPDRMERFVTVRRREGLKDASVYNEMSTLRRWLRLQWKRHRFDAASFSAVKTSMSRAAAP